jgi:hypothetical protein
MIDFPIYIVWTIGQPSEITGEFLWYPEFVNAYGPSSEGGKGQPLEIIRLIFHVFGEIISGGYDQPHEIIEESTSSETDLRRAA